MSQIAIYELSTADLQEWDALVDSSPDGSIYSRPRYLDILCAASEGRLRVIGAKRGGELVGGVALYERDSASGTFVAPRLLLRYNGFVLKRSANKYPSVRSAREGETMNALAAALEARGYESMRFRTTPSLVDVRPLLARAWSARPAYTYVIPLNDLRGQWERVEQNLRRLILRCEQRDRVRVAQDEDFDSFYHLHRVTLEAKGVKPYLPPEAFRAYYARLARLGLARLYQARLPNGHAVATQLVLLDARGMTHTVCAAGDPHHRHLGSQAYLRWKVFEALAADGYHGNDLTDATLNSVTHFKAQLGGTLQVSFVLEGPRREGMQQTGLLRRAVGWVRRALG